MADNVAITAGSGTTIATDDVSGVHFQKMKLYASTDGTEAAAGILYAEVANARGPGTRSGAGTLRPPQAGFSLSAVFVSKSLASCRSCS